MRHLQRFVRNPEELLSAVEPLAIAQPVVLELAGMGVAVAGVPEAAGRRLLRLYGPGGDSIRPVVCVDAVPEESGHFREAAAIDWDPYLAVEYRPDGVYAAGYRWLLRVHRSEPLRATLWFDGTAGGAVADDLWENVLRILMAYILLLGGGLLVHSAAISWGGAGILFPGASGDGKSSAAARCEEQGGLVLSDDCNALLPPDSSGGWRVSGLPFGGESHPRRRVPGAFPLAAVLSLRKASVTRARPLPAAETAARLMRAAPFVNADPEVAGLLARNATVVAGAAAGGVLGFTLDGDVLGTLQAFLAGGEA